MPEASFPAPIGGWNARDSVDRMAPTDAIELVNMVPAYQGVTARGGNVVVGAIADMGSTRGVETLAPYQVGGTEVLIAGANGAFYDVDPTGATTATSLASGFTNNRWQHEQFDTRMIFVNGVDTAQVFDGSTFAPLNITTGPNEEDLIGARSFKGRMFYWEANTLSFWYAAAGSFQGDLSEFSLARAFRLGGEIIDMIAYTRDAGDGVDDIAIFVSSTGEALLYQGDDPSDLDAWTLIGRYRIGQPLSRRGYVDLAADAVILTLDGYQNISTALQTARASEENSLSTPIIRAAKQSANLFKNNYGWEVTFYPAESWLIVNVPVLDVVGRIQSEQHVMNTNTGRWCKFKGWDAVTFCVFQENLFFGSSAGVHRGNFGTDDNGEPIQYIGVTSFNPMGEPERKKQAVAAAVVSDFANADAVGLTGLTDFFVGNLPTIPFVNEDIEGQWDLADWDETDWASEEGVFGQPTNELWQSIIAYGFQVAIAVQFQSRNQRPTWYSTKIKYKRGKAT